MKNASGFRAGRVLRLTLLALFGLIILCFLLPIIVYGVLNVGNLTGLLVGLAGLGSVLFWNRLRPWLKKRAEKRLEKLVFGVLAFFTAAALGCAAVISFHLIAACSDAQTDSSTVIVLGCQVNGTAPSLMLRTRIDAAKKYLDAHPQAVCILSGGQGEDEDISEAQCMYDALVRAGVDEGRLYPEDRSTSTAENIRYSLDVIRENGLSEDISIVTNEFHEYRAKLLAQRYGITASAVPAASPKILLPTYVVREWYAVLADRFLRKK